MWFRMRGAPLNKSRSYPRLRLLPLLWILAAALVSPACAQNSGPERDAWQRPREVMDELGIKPGHVVADVGCGRGYFAFYLARRVGLQGKVYAVDTKDDVLSDVRREALQQKLGQVQTILSAADDPKLPTDTLDVVLAVNTYHEWRDYDAMLDHLYQALKPGGLYATIDAAARPGEPREDYYERHRMPEELERADAERHGFRFLRKEPGFVRTNDRRQFYFLVFQKP